MKHIINTQSLLLVDLIDLLPDEQTTLDELDALAAAITFKINSGIATEQDIQEGQRLIAIAVNILERAQGRMN